MLNIDWMPLTTFVELGRWMVYFELKGVKRTLIRAHTSSKAKKYWVSAGLVARLKLCKISPF